MNMANWNDQKLFSNYYGENQIFRQYTVMVYYNILAIGQNDYMPKNDIEYFYCACILLFSAILNTIFFGDIATMAALV